MLQIVQIIQQHESVGYLWKFCRQKSKTMKNTSCPTPARGAQSIKTSNFFIKSINHIDKLLFAFVIIM